MAILNRNAFPKHFDRAIHNIFFDEYTEYPSEVEDIARITPAPEGRYDKEAELSPIGELQEIPEGTAVQFDQPVEGNEISREATEYGLGIQITKRMARDDLFGNFKQMPRSLGRSAVHKKNTTFFDLFNNGINSTTYHTAWDGKSIVCYNATASSTHQGLKSREAINNAPSTAGALSETTLQAAFEYMYKADDQAGQPTVLTPYLLIVSVDEMWNANKLHDNLMQLSSGNRDLLTTNPKYGIVKPWSVYVSRYYTSTTAFHLLAREHDFRFRWKQKPLPESADDFLTGNALFKITMEFSTYCNRYLGVYGNAGA
ncbi:MAG: hypothetical protein ABID54_14255 [Pseudomonadota bacterium]